MVNIKKILLLLLTNISLYAAGYKLPQQSSDSVALSSSNIAYSFGPDASYYNPANMAFFDDNKYYFENSFNYIHLEKTTFVPDKITDQNYVVSSRSGNFFIPSFYFVSPEYLEDWRFGFNLVAPSGVGIKWDDAYPATTAKEFSLQVAEINPSFSRRFSDSFAMAIGARMIYAWGQVDNNPNGLVMNKIATIDASRHLKGDALNFGWNIAATYKPTEKLNLAATYRSNINMKLEGDAQIISKASLTPIGEYVLSQILTPAQKAALLSSYNGKYSGRTYVSIPLPATFDLGISYDFGKIVVMGAYERTFWSKMTDFVFKYDKNVPAEAVFDRPIKKDWKDTNTYSVGLSWSINHKIRVMGGFAYDESPSNANYIGFELPDTKAFMYSTGVQYNINKDVSVQVGYLFLQRKNRHIDKADEINEINNIVGQMQNGNAHIVNLGIKYRF